MDKQQQAEQKQNTGSGWLCLSRHIGQEIVVLVGDEEIRVRVFRIESNKAMLGIQAPRHIEIVRTELLDKPPPKC